MNVHTLIPAVQQYPWGSPVHIPRLLGLENPEQTPYAELWMGTHPGGMSMVELGGVRKSLRACIEDDPGYWIGMGDDISFLFKLLAAAAPLSIQCHPDAGQARRGFAREEQEGIPRDAPNRTYRDAQHKPEILCALSPFRAMCGLRSDAELHKLASPFPMLRDLARDGCVSFVRRLFCSPKGFRQRLLQEFVQLLSVIEDDDHGIYALAREFSQRFGLDIGIASPIYLQVLDLSPGEAIFLSPGNLHAYISGFAVELMANSDNVIRGGLTKKHIDVRELLEVFSIDQQPVVPFTACRSAGDPRPAFPAAADDFLLRECAEGRWTIERADYLEIGIVISGETMISWEGGRRVYQANRGQSFVIPACIGRYSIESTGQLYLASQGVSQ